MDTLEKRLEGFFFHPFLIERPVKIPVCEEKPRIEFKAVVIGFHVFTEFVKRPVVLFFAEMGQFVHDDHPQQRLGRRFEEHRDADFVFRFDLAALEPPCEGVSSQSVVEYMDFPVVVRFTQWRGVTHELVFQKRGIFV